MFSRHRDDLKEAQAQTIKALQDSIIILADQVEYLRAQVDGRPHVYSGTPSVNPSAQPAVEDGFPKYLSEEEEELLALRLNDHINDLELEQLRADLRLAPPLLEADD